MIKGDGLMNEIITKEDIKIEDLIYHDYNITIDILMEIKDILIFDKE